MQNSFKYSTDIFTTDALGFKLEFAGAKINGVLFQASTIWAKNGKLIQKSYLDIAKSVYNMLYASGAREIKVKVHGATPVSDNPLFKHYVLGIHFCYNLPDTIEDLTRNSWFIFKRYIPEDSLLETIKIGFSYAFPKCPTIEPGTGYYPVGADPKPPLPNLNPTL